MHLEASGRHSFPRSVQMRTLSKKKEHKSKLAWRLRCIIHAPLFLETANSSGHWRLTEEPPVSVDLARFDILSHLRNIRAIKDRQCIADWWHKTLEADLSEAPNFTLLKTTENWQNAIAGSSLTFVEGAFSCTDIMWELQVKGCIGGILKNQ